MCLILSSIPLVPKSVLILSHIVLVVNISCQVVEMSPKHLPLHHMSPFYFQHIPMKSPFCSQVGLNLMKYPKKYQISNHIR